MTDSREMNVKVRAPAKINLRLHVGPVREDGFHQLSTVYCAVSLYDELTMIPASNLTLRVTGEGAEHLPADDTNLVIRAANLLAARTGRRPSGDIQLHKGIPVAAGLAGGSADAAATLMACNQLWDCGLDRDQLEELARELGSDVPFSLVGGVAVGEGRGELLRQLPSDGLVTYWVLAAADYPLSTPKVYAELDRLREFGQALPPKTMDLATITAQEAIDGPLVNDLQAGAYSLAPALREVATAGMRAGARYHLVSGSGPTMIFTADDEQHAQRIAGELEASQLCRWARVVHGPVAGAAASLER